MWENHVGMSTCNMQPISPLNNNNDRTRTQINVFDDRGHLTFRHFAPQRIEQHQQLVAIQCFAVVCVNGIKL